MGVLIRQCLFRALYQRHYDEAVELAAQPYWMSVRALPALTSRPVVDDIPADKFISIASHIISRGGRAYPAAEDAAEDAESNGEAADAAAAGPDVADEVEGKESIAAPSQALESMTPQQLAEFIVTVVTEKLNKNNPEQLLLILKEFAAHNIGISEEVADKLIGEGGLNAEVEEALKQLKKTKFQVPDRITNQRMETRRDLVEEYLNYDHDEGVKRLLLNKRLEALCLANDSRAPEVYKETSRVLPWALRAYVRYACTNDSSLGMDCWREHGDRETMGSIFVSFASKLVKDGNVDDALEILTKKKDFIERNASYNYVGDLMFALNSSPDERCQNFLKEILGEKLEVQRTFYTSQLNLLLGRQEFEAAVDLMETISPKVDLNKMRYQVRKLAAALVENEKYELLQRLQNILTAALGELESLCELSLVLLHCRKDRQAKRIIELSGQPSRVIRRVLLSNDLRSLESLLEILPAFHPQRDEICERVVYKYNEQSDAENALALYTRFEQENYTPSQKVLVTLKDLFLRCGYEVPFDTSLITDTQTPAVDQSPQTPKYGPAAAIRPQETTGTPERRVRGPQEAENAGASKKEGAAGSKVADLDSLKAMLINNPDTPRKAFHEAFRRIKVPQDQKNEFRNELISEAIREDNYERLILVLPYKPRSQFDALLRFLKTSPRDNYIQMMEKHVGDLEVMLRAYWFDAFLRGDDKVCEDLWLKHGLFGMISSHDIRAKTYLAGHEGRYFKFLKKVNVPPAKAAGPLVNLARSKLKTSAEAALEVLEQNAEIIPHLRGRTWKQIRNSLVESKAGEALLNRFDELWKKHGVNVKMPES